MDDRLPLPEDGETPTQLPEVHFGSVGAPLPNWRQHPNTQEDDPDDEELEQTPPDVIDLLGFDPKDPEEDDNPEEDKHPPAV